MSSKQAGVKVQKPQGFEQQLADRVALRPGVEAVTLMDPVPLWFGGNSAHFEALNSQPPGPRLRIGYSRVAPDYFDVLKIPLLRGATSHGPTRRRRHPWRSSTRRWRVRCGRMATRSASGFAGGAK